MRDYETHNGGSKDETLLKLKSIAKNLAKEAWLLAILDEDIIKQCQLNDITSEVYESTNVTTQIHKTVAKIDAFEKTVQTNLRNETIAQHQMNRVSTPQGISAIHDQVQTEQVGIPQGISEVKSQEKSDQASTPQGIRTRSDIFNILPSNDLNLSVNSLRINVAGIKLPKLNLPQLNGNITNFQPFLQSFKSAIDSSTFKTLRMAAQGEWLRETGFGRKNRWFKI